MTPERLAEVRAFAALLSASLKAPALSSLMVDQLLESAEVGLAELLEEVERLSTERDARKEERDSYQHLWIQVRDELGALKAKERADVIPKLSDAVAILAERDALKAERDGMQCDLEALRADRDKRFEEAKRYECKWRHSAGGSIAVSIREEALATEAAGLRAALSGLVEGLKACGIRPEGDGIAVNLNTPFGCGRVLDTALAAARAALSAGRVP